MFCPTKKSDKAGMYVSQKFNQPRLDVNLCKESLLQKGGLLGSTPFTSVWTNACNTCKQKHHPSGFQAKRLPPEAWPTGANSKELINPKQWSSAHGFTLEKSEWFSPILPKFLLITRPRRWGQSAGPGMAEWPSHPGPAAGRNPCTRAPAPCASSAPAPPILYLVATPCPKN